MGGELRLANGPGGLSAGPISASVGSTLGLGQTGPVTVTLDKSLPNGPWDAKILMRSGATTRETSASITFPERTASESTPVSTASERSGGVAVAAGVGVGVVVLVVILFVLLARGRRKKDDEPS